ncbi:hypothetical protein IQ272_32920 [Chroococcidiopsidales cyanobacterium LEGE 13417]|nr:hypothetical protein [Chroococcidiopsidales cyanobacterium LEGE 13417]
MLLKKYSIDCESPSTNFVEAFESRAIANYVININRELLVSWLFLIGSLIFTLDSILEFFRGVTFSAILHVSASVLFTIGSVLFIPNSKEK